MTADHLHALGADAAYAKLLENGVRAHFIGYYAMVMGLAGRPWNDCQGSEKVALRARFDVIKAEIKSPVQSEFDKMMDVIGIR